jgi:hypothetical protein
VLELDAVRTLRLRRERQQLADRVDQRVRFEEL